MVLCTWDTVSKNCSLYTKFVCIGKTKVIQKKLMKKTVDAALLFAELITFDNS